MWQRNGDGDQTQGANGNLVGFAGQNCTIQGTLNFTGTFRIDGRIEGQVTCDGTLIVGEGGQVHADIQATVVVCGGTIEGNIVAKERVQLLAPSVITGTVRSPLLIIEEGAQFNGTCEMERPAAAGSKPAKKDKEEEAEAHAALSHHRSSRAPHSSSHD
ncbi:MAG: polymer-forming cytoskeletal protein [Nitrospirae bacterium]|nr:polymer-forming cytoskeletal protein [Nitrospirota bacterium]